MARTFANPSGITCSAGAVGTLLGNAFTFATICRRTSDNDYHALISLEASGPNHRGGLWITNGGGSGGDLQVVSSGFDTSFGFTIPNNTWVFLATTKPDGDGVTPSGWMYRYDTNAWSTASGVGTVNEDSMTIATVRIGNSENADFWFIGDIHLDAGWSRALSDAELRQLPFSLQAWYASAPTFGHLLDQQATTQSVIDWTGGGANQTSLSNTSIATTSLPVFSYGFDVSTPHSAPAAGGPINVNIGQAIETDTATLFGRSKAKSAGQASETDTATAVSRRKTRTFGQGSEPDTATTFGRAKTRSFGQSAETDTANAVSRLKVRSFNTATETDTATTLGRAKSKLTGKATETNTAQTITPSTSTVVNIGQAVEADTATTFGRAKRKAVGQPVEADTATAFTASDALIVGQASETDTAQPFGRIKRVTLGQALETATAGLMTAVKSRLLGLAAETDTATVVSRRKAKTLGQTTETDAAFSIAPPDSGIIFRPNTGTVARPGTGTITRPNTGIILRP